MDFKSELQNLVNRYPGMIKRVRVEFVEELAVEPNGAPALPTIQYQPVPAPTRVAPKVKQDLFTIEETVKPFPGQTVGGASPMPTEKKSFDPQTASALQATLAELNKTPII